MSTPQEKASIASQRHKREITQVIKVLGHDPEALADTVAVLSVFTAGRIVGMAQTLDIMQPEGR